ncbi:MAG: nickel-binding protein [Actinomycetota bacterium]
MPLFLVEREYAEQLVLDDETNARSVQYELRHEMRWVTSFLSADKKKAYCLYEVDDAEILRQHASDLGLPLDAIVEVSEITR